MARTHGKPISSGNSKGGRGCLGLFMLVWGTGFGGGGLMALIGGFESSSSGDDWARWIIGPLFTLIGGGAVVFGLLTLLGKVQPGGIKKSQATAAPRPLAADAGSPTGDVVLRAGKQKSCALLFLIPFTVGWNTMVVFMADELGGDAMGWLFVLVFGGAGLAMVLLVFYLLLALTNPTAEIEVDADGVGTDGFAVGRTTTIVWRMRGSTNRLPALTIALEGAEEASYTRGTDRVTDRETFYRAVLAEGPELLADAARDTELEVTIPAGGVPSFEAGSNKIVWRLCFEADIPWWPDVKDQIVIPVGPGAPHPREELR